MRCRIQGVELYVCGCSSAAQASAEMRRRRDALDAQGKPMGTGPHRTSLAQALQDYGLSRLRFLKGARQDADRINKLLRAAGLAPLKVTPWKAALAKGLVEESARASDRKGRGQHHWVELAAIEPQRRLPKSLAGHRHRLASETARSDVSSDARN
jgi:hypothetical protein